MIGSFSQSRGIYITARHTMDGLMVEWVHLVHEGPNALTITDEPFLLLLTLFLNGFRPLEKGFNTFFQFFDTLIMGVG